MKLTNLKFFIFALIAVTYFISCSKDDTSPIITILEPGENDTIHASDTLHVEATVTDEYGLTHIHYHVESISGVEFLHRSFDTSAIKSYSIHKHLVPPVTLLTKCTFEVQAINNKGKATSKEISFFVKP